MRNNLLTLAFALTAAMPVEALGQHVLHEDPWNANPSQTAGESYALLPPQATPTSLQDSKRQATHWKRGAVIGAAVGLVIGAPVGYATFDQEAFDAGRQCNFGSLGCPEPLSRAGRTVVGGVVGASFGFLVGALIGRQITVEITPAATRGMNVRVAFPN